MNMTEVIGFSVDYNNLPKDRNSSITLKLSNIAEHWQGQAMPLKALFYLKKTKPLWTAYHLECQKMILKELY